MRQHTFHAPHQLVGVDIRVVEIDTVAQHDLAMLRIYRQSGAGRVGATPVASQEKNSGNAAQ